MVLHQEKINGNTISLSTRKNLFVTLVTDEQGYIVISHKTFYSDKAEKFYESVADVLSIKTIVAN